ncbi:MAG: nucleotidyl transferase AbiEii/AbiGii toxin family protein [Kiritimatiellia bacterium]
MIPIEQILNFYPPALTRNAAFQKHILKEYVQLQVLDFLATTADVRNIIFIGGTNLRLVKGIDRFSEDLDFDCKLLDEKAFEDMTESVLLFLRRSGFAVEARDRDNSRLTAFRRSLYFPELLFNLGLTGHREERFLLKLEAQDQGVAYTPQMAFIKGCGLFFAFPVPPDAVLCAMKLAALLNRGKGRDYYDAMFLLAQTQPDYAFLAARCGVTNLQALKAAIHNNLQAVDLNQKHRDFEHLLFDRDNSRRILHFREFVNAL